ncbi:MAG: ferredoxin-thioredoxin reductase catalytic domain-containing protein [Myxococcota bacterium]
MNTDNGFNPKVVDLHDRLAAEALEAGYAFNPDRAMTLQLVEGLLANEARYGYRACPCRLAFGDRQKDLDVVCPCDYRDADVVEFGACYCGLYVGPEIAAGRETARPIPERRPERFQFAGYLPAEKSEGGRVVSKAIPVWRCRVCGYLCAREAPPAVCPICKAKKDRFETFSLSC